MPPHERNPHRSSPRGERRIQLRRAVSPATIGTAIEWYDFFLYSTVTGLVFAPLYFPNSDPLVGTLQAFGIYAVGFVARPIGAAIFGHYGDRIGRKSALIATLLLMGIATFLVALRADVRAHRDLGRGHPDRAALRAGHRRRRRVGRIGPAVDGMGAIQPASRLHRVVAAVRRAGGTVPRQSRGAGVQRALRRPVPGLGLAHSVPAQHRPRRDRPLHPARHPRDAGVRAAGRREAHRARAGRRSDQAATERDPPDRALPHGRAGAVLHLHGVRLRLRNRHAHDLAATSC